MNYSKHVHYISALLIWAFVSFLGMSRFAHAQLGAVTSAARKGGQLEISVGPDKLIVRICQANMVNIDYQPNGKSAPETVFLAPAKWDTVPATFGRLDADPIVVTTSALTVSISRSPCRVSIYDANKRLLLKEQDARGAYPGGLDLSCADGSHFFGLRGWDFLQHAGSQVELEPRDAPYDIRAGGEGNTGGPFVWSNKGYAVYVDTAGAKCAVGGAPASLEFSEISKPDVDYYVMVGNAYDVHTALDSLTGLPPMFPKWALGLFNSEFCGIVEPTFRDIVDGYRTRGIPFDTYVFDFDWKDWSGDDYGEWRWNPVKFPTGPTGQLKKDMDAKGIKMVGIMKPRIHTATTAGRYATDHGFWVKRPFYTDYFDHGQVGDLDFMIPECRQWFWDHSEGAYDRGIIGWWNDEADAWGDNFEFLKMAQAEYEGQRKYTRDRQRVYTINRNFYSGSQRYAYATWSGDIDSGFGVMQDQRARLLASLNIGQAKWGMDTGGFNNSNRIRGEEASECYARWMEFDAFVPIFRLHGTSRRQPWLYGPVAEAAAKKAVRLRYSLLPYLYSYDHTLTETGIGICRPLIWDFPDDPNCVNDVDAWMFGDSLLVAPVVEEKQSVKKIYLPAGTWTDYFRGTVYTGARTIDYPVNPATWDDIPLFIKAGAIIPSMEAMNYVGEKPLTTVSVDVFPGAAETHFTYYDDDGVSYDYEKGSSFSQLMTAHAAPTNVLFTIAPRAGKYKPELQYYVCKIHGHGAKAVSVNGKALPNYAGAAELNAGSGEGWTNAKDIYGDATWVKVAAGVARNIEVQSFP